MYVNSWEMRGVAKSDDISNFYTNGFLAAKSRFYGMRIYYIVTYLLD